jgi:hypothetical protein
MNEEGTPTNDPASEREQLQARLAELEKQDREQAAEKQRAEQAEREQQLDPATLKQKQEIDKRADEALDREYPPSWLPQKNPEQPQQIAGLVLRIDPRVGPSKTYGTYSAVIEVRATDGNTWTLWANESGAMYAQLLRLRIQPGEVIAVRYRGLKESEATPGQKYHDFRLVRVDDDQDGPAPPVDYDQLTAGQETPALPAPTNPGAPDDDIPF